MDAAAAASESAPRCSFCQELLPATPIAAAAAAVTAIPGFPGSLGGIIDQALQGNLNLGGGGPMILDTKAHLHTDGLPGRATIVSAREVMDVMGTHMMEFQLQVELPGKTPYMAMTKAAVVDSAMPAAAVGSQCAVKVDPRDEHAVLIEWS
ncbi:MAG: hypothetical protein M3N98_00250 [Actinomycetota bacterium]|nr:hypothetical protein [Actinomycetota bacterium]